MMPFRIFLIFLFIVLFSSIPVGVWAQFDESESSNNPRVRYADLVDRLESIHDPEQFSSLLKEALLSFVLSEDGKPFINNVFTHEGDTYTPLKYAIKKSWQGSVLELIAEGADCQGIDRSILQSLLPTLSQFLQNPNLSNILLKGPEVWQARLQRLIDAGMDTRWLGEEKNDPVLIALFQLNNPQLALFLIQQGLPVNGRGAHGYTPLHWAARYEHYDLMDALLIAGADPTAQTYWRTMPSDLLEGGVNNPYYERLTQVMVEHPNHIILDLLDNLNLDDLLPVDLDTDSSSIELADLLAAEEELEILNPTPWASYTKDALDFFKGIVQMNDIAGFKYLMRHGMWGPSGALAMASPLELMGWVFNQNNFAPDTLALLRIILQYHPAWDRLTEEEWKSSDMLHRLLIYAGFGGNTIEFQDTIALFLSLGGYLSINNDFVYGRPLYVACYYRMHDVIRLLVHCGAELDDADDNEQLQKLILLAQHQGNVAFGEDLSPRLDLNLLPRLDEAMKTLDYHDLRLIDRNRVPEPDEDDLSDALDLDDRLYHTDTEVDYGAPYPSPIRLYASPSFYTWS